MPNGTLLNVLPTTLRLGAFRDEYVKPAMHLLLGLGLAIVAVLAVRGLVVRHEALRPRATWMMGWAVLGLIVLGGAIALATPRLLDYMVISRFALDASHFWVALMLIGLGIVLALQKPRPGATQTTPRRLSALLWAAILWSVLCGVLMMVNLSPLAAITRLAYTGLDGGLAMTAVLSVLVLALRLAVTPVAQQKVSVG